LRLALLEWPGEPHLVGHSDGDVAAHAIIDALCSACGLGDIGELFGTDRPQWRGASGADLLAHVVELVRAAGWSVVNVAVQIVAVRPRLAGRRGEAEAALSAVLGAPVNVAASTTDGLGFTGEGKGAAAIATALLRR
jgi:2-C-methyl-D-erythritol 2,4-cyclodiphosphate synthase